MGTDEWIESTDPPSGVLDPSAPLGPFSFVVTFDKPNYVYPDEITVEVTGGIAPVVTQTRRLDNGDSKTIEIVLSHMIPPGETTTFTFENGETVEYTLPFGEACCLPEGDCVVVDPAECASELGGVAQGPDSTCEGDVDGDGVDGQCGDECPTDGNKLAPGLCGCGLPDTDSDHDGTLDCHDGCPNDPAKIEPGACGCHTPDTDSDGDTIPDCHDLCDGLDDRHDFNDNGVPDCAENIPTVSGWGLIVLTLLLLIAAKLAFNYQRAA